MAFLNKAASRKIVEREKDVYELRLNKLYLIVGLIAIVIGFIGVIILLITLEINSLYMAIALNIFFTPLGLICYLWYHNHILTFNNSEISATSWLGKTSTLKWVDINDISFNALSGQLILKGNSKVIKAHQHLVGIDLFVQTLKERTNLSIDNLKLPFQIKNNSA